ncbi:MAG: hypothetical protein J6B26_07170 [Agathobacter sp.]|nr:hypothetical protein [Agathobacter sp.]MBQ2282974.1 hypothetical protein [Agathobacter sp.]
MSEYNFKTYWKDELTAEVKADDCRVYIKRYTTHPAKQLFWKDEISRFELGQVLELRCWDRNRANLNLYLDELGIKDFNPYEICRKTHGVMVQDFIWFQFDGENLSFKDVRFKR